MAIFGWRLDDHMLAHQREFLELTLRLGVLRFGRFTLKSGRDSPYFFNAGLFDTGKAIDGLGQAYAAALEQSGLQYDMLFGPAYKGIPLVTATAAALAQHHAKSIPFAFNRKEAKAHGEGGRIVGRALTGCVLIVDDVITAGTAIRESIEIIQEAGAVPAGVLLALDRQEQGRESTRSAVQEVRDQFGLPVVSILTLSDLIAGIESGFGELGATTLSDLKTYQTRYGAAP